MKHFYSQCPDNPDGSTPWGTKETNCPRCLQDLILGYEDYYQDNPENAIIWLTSDLQHDP